MNLDTKELESIRKYLLGQSPDGERTQIEQRLLSETDYFDEVLIGEEELIDEFVANQLSESARQAFENNFLVTAEREKSLRFARRWKKYVGEVSGTVKQEASSSDDQPYDSVNLPTKRRPFFSFFPLQNPILSYSLAAVILLAVVGVSWVAVKNWRTSETSPGKVLAVTLAPGLTRDGGDTPRIKLSPGIGSVEMRLTLPKTDYRVYRSELLADDRSQVWASGDLTALNDSGISFVTTSIPARLLTPGDYRIAVSGRSNDGTFEDIATYSFRVLR